MKGQYRLQYNNAYVDYSGPDVVEVGKIVDTTTNEDAMFIYYEKGLYRRRGYHICIEEYEREEGDYPVAVIDDLHRSCIFEHPEIFLTLMLHELGHYRNGDLSVCDGEDIKSDSMREARLDAIRNGKVELHELKADAFAVCHVGKNTFMRTMDYMINRRRERGDNGMELAIKEFELRKKAIQKMK